jgi:signal transduction histidine kinase
VADTHVLKAVSDAVLAIASQRSVDDVLQELVHRARELAGARYAALGTPDGAGGFSRFLVSGMSDELIASLGPLPRTHGMLGLMLEQPGSYRTHDIHEHPRFRGWWPAGHPDMRSFLGVPIVAADGVIGAFYLTGDDDFTQADQELIELLAAHAAIAITNARLYERSRELSVVSERNRLARELHDAVSQKLFGVVLSAESAATLLERDSAAAGTQIARAGELAQAALEELRALIEELRPPELERDGLCEALRKHAALLERLHDTAIDVRVDDVVSFGDDEAVLRIAQEALHNAVRHAGAQHVSVRLSDGLLEVADDGTGFDPTDVRSRHLGLTSMEERARALGGRLVIRSTPGEGTTVRLETQDRA